MPNPKYLVYLTVGFHPDFARLTELCVRSIRENNDMSLIDICVMCDESYAPLVAPLDTNLHITGQNPTAVCASMRKLEVFDLPNIYDYDQVLFLDSDIVVCGNLVPIFEEAAAAGNHFFHGYEEDYNDPHRAPWFSLYTYDETEIRALDAAGIRGMNAGQFLFAPTAQMKGHFDAIREMVRTHKGHYHYEQSFVNVYFNRRPHLTERQVLQKYVRIYPTYDRYEPGKVIVHFNGDGGGGPYIKLLKMQRYYELHNNHITQQLK